MIGKILKKVLRAAIAQPWDYVGEGAPHDWEFRLSPDGRHLAIWEPGNEPWFVIDTAFAKGRWADTPEMERNASDWIPFLPLADPDE